MRRRFVIAGTLLGGVLLSFLNWLTAALLPPRYKQFRDPGAVVETIRANVSGNDIYTAPQGLFVSVSLRPGSAGGPQNFGARVVRQFTTEFVVAFIPKDKSAHFEDLGKQPSDHEHGLASQLGATRIFPNPNRNESTAAPPGARHRGRRLLSRLDAHSEPTTI